MRPDIMDMDRTPAQEDQSKAALEAFASAMRTVLSGSNFPEVVQRELVGDIVCALADAFGVGRGAIGAKPALIRSDDRLGIVEGASRDDSGQGVPAKIESGA